MSIFFRAEYRAESAWGAEVDNQSAHVYQRGNERQKILWETVRLPAALAKRFKHLQYQ